LTTIALRDFEYYTVFLVNPDRPPTRKVSSKCFRLPNAVVTVALDVRYQAIDSP
jgi:hypothetical protein